MSILAHTRHTIRLKRCLLLATVVSAALTGGFSANAADVPTPEYGGVAIMAMSAEPTTLTPTLNSAAPETYVGNMLFDALINVDYDGNILPSLAESWDISKDGLSYTFHLRDATFHDGQPFTSEDVRFSLMEVAKKMNSVFAAQGGRVLVDIETPDPRTAVARLSEPFGPFLLSLQLQTGGAMLPKHVFEGTDIASNPASVSHPVGTGPFVFEEYVRGSHIRVSRNDNYWDKGKPYLDEVVAQFMPNSSSRTQALLAGEVDFISFSQFPSADRHLVDENQRLKAERSGNPPNMLYAFLNLKNQYLSDVRVRHALLVASDRQFIAENAFAGSGEPGRAPWAKQLAWTDDPDVDYDVTHAFDPARAAKMLDEAGYPAGANGIRFSLRLAYDSAIPERALVASALQANWRAAGVDLQLEPVEVALLGPRQTSGDFDVTLVSYTTFGDPALGVSRSFVTSAIGRLGGNLAGYSNPEVDKMFDDAARLVKREDRLPIYNKIQEILMRDMPAITLHENLASDVASAHLYGIWGTTHLNWGNTWIEQ